nr:MAG TPA: hypothetical protein [Caudoviricetes sp.]
MSCQENVIVIAQFEWLRPPASNLTYPVCV